MPPATMTSELHGRRFVYDIGGEQMIWGCLMPVLGVDAGRDCPLSPRGSIWGYYGIAGAAARTTGKFVYFT